MVDTEQQTLTSQMKGAVREMSVWLGPVLLAWIVATALMTVVATPWWIQPDAVSIGLGVAGGTLFALIYARHRLDQLASMEATA